MSRVSQIASVPSSSFRSDEEPADERRTVIYVRTNQSSFPTGDKSPQVQETFKSEKQGRHSMRPRVKQSTI